MDFDCEGTYLGFSKKWWTIC